MVEINFKCESGDIQNVAKAFEVYAQTLAENEKSSLALENARVDSEKSEKVIQLVHNVITQVWPTVSMLVKNKCTNGTEVSAEDLTKKIANNIARVVPAIFLDFYNFLKENKKEIDDKQSEQSDADTKPEPATETNTEPDTPQA